MATAISFNTNDLQTSSIVTARIGHSSIPAKEAKLYTIAKANKSSIPVIEYPAKIIPVSGKLIGTSIANMDALEDTFKSYFRGTAKNLDIGHAGSTRRYIATATSVVVDRPGGLHWANFEIEFTCTHPFGMDTSATVITNTANHTSASLNVTPTIAGTAPYQYPIITITIDAFTGTNEYIQISNDNNGQGILIANQGFAAADVIEIDCFERTVKLNGDLIDYTGVFLELEPGSQSLTYADGFATRTVDIDIVYYKRYL